MLEIDSRSVASKATATPTVSLWPSYSSLRRVDGSTFRGYSECRLFSLAWGLRVHSWCFSGLQEMLVTECRLPSGNLSAPVC